MLLQKSGSYYEDFRRIKGVPATSLPESKRLLTDRSAYISYLEVQLERVSAACMTAEGFSDRIEQQNGQIQDLQAQVLNISKRANGAHTHSQQQGLEMAQAVTALHSEVNAIRHTATETDARAQADRQQWRDDYDSRLVALERVFHEELSRLAAGAQQSSDALGARFDSERQERTQKLDAMQSSTSEQFAAQSRAISKLSSQTDASINSLSQLVTTSRSSTAQQFEVHRSSLQEQVNAAIAVAQQSMASASQVAAALSAVVQASRQAPVSYSEPSAGTTACGHGNSGATGRSGPAPAAQHTAAQDNRPLHEYEHRIGALESDISQLAAAQDATHAAVQALGRRSFAPASVYWQEGRVPTGESDASVCEQAHARVSTQVQALEHAVAQVQHSLTSKTSLEDSATIEASLEELLHRVSALESTVHGEGEASALEVQRRTLAEAHSQAQAQALAEAQAQAQAQSQVLYEAQAQAQAHSTAQAAAQAQALAQVQQQAQAQHEHYQQSLRALHSNLTELRACVLETQQFTEGVREFASDAASRLQEEVEAAAAKAGVAQDVCKKLAADAVQLSHTNSQRLMEAVTSLESKLRGPSGAVAAGSPVDVTPADSALRRFDGGLYHRLGTGVGASSADAAAYGTGPGGGGGGGAACATSTAGFGADVAARHGLQVRAGTITPRSDSLGAASGLVASGYVSPGLHALASTPYGTGPASFNAPVSAGPSYAASPAAGGFTGNASSEADLRRIAQMVASEAKIEQANSLDVLRRWMELKVESIQGAIAGTLPAAAQQHSGVLAPGHGLPRHSSTPRISAPAAGPGLSPALSSGMLSPAGFSVHTYTSSSPASASAAQPNTPHASGAQGQAHPSMHVDTRPLHQYESQGQRTPGQSQSGTAAAAGTLRDAVHTAASAGSAIPPSGTRRTPAPGTSPGYCAAGVGAGAGAGVGTGTGAVDSRGSCNRGDASVRSASISPSPTLPSASAHTAAPSVVGRGGSGMVHTPQAHTHTGPGEIPSPGSGHHSSSPFTLTHRHSHPHSLVGSVAGGHVGRPSASPVVARGHAPPRPHTHTHAPAYTHTHPGQHSDSSDFGSPAAPTSFTADNDELQYSVTTCTTGSDVTGAACAHVPPCPSSASALSVSGRVSAHSTVHVRASESEPGASCRLERSHRAGDPSVSMDAWTGTCDGRGSAHDHSTDVDVYTPAQVPRAAVRLTSARTGRSAVRVPHSPASSHTHAHPAAQGDVTLSREQFTALTSNRGLHCAQSCRLPAVPKQAGARRRSSSCSSKS